MLTVGDIFSGIGGFSAGFDAAGCRTVFFCEIDGRCRSVLRRHWPGVPRFRDVNTVTGAALRAHGLVPTVLVGGFPCQDLSVAGARAGLDGERSRLFWEFARIAEEARPEWVLIENVPGLLSSGRGRDMGTVLRVMADIGYRLAWRVLDAQWFGVAQRRRRVFIVGRLGDGHGPAWVLFEPEGVRRDPPTRREAGQEIAGTLGGGSGTRGWCNDLDRATFIPAVSNALCSSRRGQRNDPNEQTFLPVAYGLSENQRAEVNLTEEYSRQIIAVRRLTPLECLRLQGFPDDHLDGLGLPDSARYRMVGNAVAVPVVAWIARRVVAYVEAERACGNNEKTGVYGGLSQKGGGAHCSARKGGCREHT